MNATDRGPRDHRIVISRFVEACRADDRIVAAFLYGSHARGEADEYSDLDLCLIATDEDYEDVSAGRAAIIDRLGQPLFLEDFGLEGIVFSILSGGTDVELLLGRESRFDEIHVGPYLTLLDKKGILAGAEFPSQEPDRAEQMEALHRALVWFWHELSRRSAVGSSGGPTDSSRR